MRVAILGPVECTVNGSVVLIGTGKERALLAALALHGGRRVAPERLIDALWGDDPPPTARRTLGTHISRLRRVIGDGWIGNENGGFVLGVERDDVDVLQFEDLVDATAVALDSGRPDVASRQAKRALDLWRGEPLADLTDGAVSAGSRARLDELRGLALDRRIAAELALGHHDQVVGEIEAAIAEAPLREPLWRSLVLALYRSGRQVDALRAVARLRAVLADELGLEPSQALADIEQHILRQDPRLDLTPPKPPNNLPVASSSFVGRVRDARGIEADLSRCRLVTLTGPPGVGKSRLALEVAHRLVESFSDGVFWVDLAAVRDPAAIVAQSAGALGVNEPRSGSLHEAIDAFVRTRELLVVFDNCEHLIVAATGLIRRLLEHGPSVTVLASSRVRLALAGECAVPLSPLATPGVEASDRDLIASDAVQLFLDRSGTSRDDGGGDLHAVAEICRRLDGVPLAIELVAARTTYLSPGDLLARLADRFESLAAAHGLADPRYDSLHEALDWSYRLLSPGQRAVFERLSVFPASFDLDAVHAVAAAESDERLDDFGHLVDASLVDPVDQEVSCPEHQGRRFRMLESIRRYAADRMQTGAERETRRRHADHYRSLTREVSPSATTGLAWLQREDANLRVAVAWSLEHDDRATTLEFADALGAAWFQRGDLGGCRRLLDKMLEGATGAPPGMRGVAMLRQAWPLMLAGEGERAWQTLDAAAELASEAGDGELACGILMARGHALLLGIGAIDAAIPFYEDAIAISDPSKAGSARTSAQLGLAQALVVADRPEGLDRLLAEVECQLSAGEDDDLLAHLWMDRALLAWCVGDDEAVVAAAQRGCEHARLVGNTSWEQINLAAVGIGELAVGATDRAEMPLLRAAKLALDSGNVMQLGVALQGLAALSAARGDAPTAARLLGSGQQLAPLWPLMQRRLGPYLAFVRGELGDSYEIEVERGHNLTPEQAVALTLLPRAR